MAKDDLSMAGDPSRGLAAATLGFFVGFAAVALYGPAAKNFKEAMELSGVMLGLLVAAPQLSGSLLRIPFGAWVDKEGGRKPFLLLLGLSLIGMAGLTTILHLYYPEGLTGEMYPLILLFGMLSGCGVATFSVGIPQTAYWFPQGRQGWALAVYAGLGNTAPGFFTLLLPFALIALGLTGAYSAWLLFLLLGTALYALTARDAYFFQLVKKGVSEKKAESIARIRGQELFPRGNAVEALKTSAGITRTWALVALYFTSFGGFLALIAWLPTYWMWYHGLGPREAGVLTAAGFALLASFVRVYGGRLSDRFGGEKTAMTSFGLILSGAVSMTLAESFYPALFGEVLMGAGMGVANAAVFKLVPRYVPEAVGGASGWVGGLGAFGGFILPPAMGFFVDAMGEKGYATGFLVYAALALTAMYLSYSLMRHPVPEPRSRPLPTGELTPSGRVRMEVVYLG
jgi:NNP family nitrate/nitrite transporter-like MFS transporter